VSVALVTGSSGLVGSETVEFLSGKFGKVVGIDNDLRKRFFGNDATTEWNRKRLEKEIPRFEHHALDIRDEAKVEALFKKYGPDLKLIVHTAGQPSHDWAAANGRPITALWETVFTALRIGGSNVGGEEE
jgi:CDP-paratose 2-epimerase